MRPLGWIFGILLTFANIPLVTADMVLAPPAPPLLVDFGSSANVGGGPGGTQPGYVAFEGVDGGALNTMTFASGLGIGGMVDVSLQGNTHHRDYGAIVGGPGVPLSSLLSDNALRNTDGFMTLTLDNLIDGTYQITTYHHDSVAGGSVNPAEIRLTDANVTGQVVFNDVLTTGGTSPDPLEIRSFEFEVLGGNSVSIELERNAVAVGGQHVALSGFDLAILPPPPLTPEPATWALFGICLGALGLSRLRLRRR